MGRRKTILPNWSVSGSLSNDKTEILNNFTNLSKGELIINTKKGEETLSLLNDNDEIIQIESSAIIDKKIEDESKRAIEIEKGLNDKIVEIYGSAITYTDKSIDLLISGATEAFDTLKEVEEWVNSHSSITIDIITDINDINKTITDLSGSTINEFKSVNENVNILSGSVEQFSASTVKNVNDIIKMVESLEDNSNDSLSEFSAWTVETINEFNAATEEHIKRLDTERETVSAITTENIERIDATITEVSAITTSNIERIDKLYQENLELKDRLKNIEEKLGL